MIEYENITVKTPKKIICDKCGHEEEPSYGEIINIKHDCGYWSKAYEDGTHIEIDICVKCLKEAFGDFIRSENKFYK